MSRERGGISRLAAQQLALNSALQRCGVALRTCATANDANIVSQNGTRVNWRAEQCVDDKSGERTIVVVGAEHVERGRIDERARQRSGERGTDTDQNRLVGSRIDSGQVDIGQSGMLGGRGDESRVGVRQSGAQGVNQQQIRTK